MPAPCEDCGASAERGQRYCLDCGARAGARSPQLDELLRPRARRPPSARSADVAVPAASAPAAPTAGSRAGLGSRYRLSLPSSRVSALLVLMFLGFGVFLGSAAGSPVQDTLARGRRPALKLILPRPRHAALVVARRSPSSSSHSEVAAANPNRPDAASAPTPSRDRRPHRAPLNRPRHPPPPQRAERRRRRTPGPSKAGTTG